MFLPVLVRVVMGVRAMLLRRHRCCRMPRVGLGMALGVRVCVGGGVRVRVRMAGRGALPLPPRPERISDSGQDEHSTHQRPFDPHDRAECEAQGDEQAATRAVRGTDQRSARATMAMGIQWSGSTE